ncbi:SDR family oxidoreductase [Aquimarina sp. AD10]|uniref:NAD-dependent dehydratase n=1 Tax=Aquimarina aggregata TaxID=1642818 RepID=A0A163CST6_9FLAO|nr:SDR family oxidoreductase [Aquimarina sp. AD10]KZS42730.1 NAD-dependent dehydratase [Aquimarina aggregata]RKM97599.1 SDR family oxidoreductase [Aquimarina sp. AD10]
MDLKNKTVLLTGASDGIGKETADFLMQMGAKVAVHYNSNTTSAGALVATYVTTASKAFKADLSNEQEVCDLFNEVKKSFGKIDVIILNAGVFLSHPTSEDTCEWFSTWRRTMDVNLNSVGLLTKLGLDHFLENGEGRFIYIGSRAVFRGETEEYLAYAASKGGIVSLARSVARSFGKRNIKSFIVSPGFTRTQMAEQFIADHGEQKVLDEIALNTLTTPKDISPLIGMMCSGLMDHATGATIDVNAGSHIR